MEKKRLVWIVGLLLGVFFLEGVTALNHYTEEDAHPVFNDASLGLNYTYALGVGRDDDMDTGGCTAEEDATLDPESMVISQIKEKENIILKVRGHTGGDSCDGCDLPIDTDKFLTCGWNIPLPQDGCYFLAQEHDSDQGTDDCMGWKIPLGTTIDTTAGKLTGESILQKISSTAFSDQKFSKFFDETDLINGEWSPADDGDAACIMKKLFALKNTAYLCSQNPEEEAVWFICDSSTKGKILEKDETTGYLCEDSDAGFKWAPINLDCENVKKIGGTCDTSMPACVNTYGEKETKTEGEKEKIIGGSAWNKEAQAGEENKCCGDDGLDDFGTISKDGTHLCYNEDAGNKIKTAFNTKGVLDKADYADIEETLKVIPGSSWKWVSASTYPFKVYDDLGTKKNNGFDFNIVSNGDDWIRCFTEETKYKTLNQPEVSTEKANRFVCTTGTTAVSTWKECYKSDEAAVDFFNKDSPFNFFTEGEYAQRLVFNAMDDSSKYFSLGDKAGKTKNYFVEKPIGFTISFEQPDPDTKITVKTAGKNQEMTESFSLIPFLQDPQIGKTYYHAKFSLVNEKAITNVEISSKDYKITSIKNAYVDYSANPICSGEGSIEKNSWWISDLDKSKLACEANGLEWTGTKCCGDDAIGLGDGKSSEDYYSADIKEGAGSPFEEAAPESKGPGCWGGKTISIGESVGEVSIKVEDDVLSYPCVLESKDETKEKCWFFIPGGIDLAKKEVKNNVKISNPFPEKYDLYAAKFGDPEKDKILLTVEGKELDRSKYFLKIENLPATASMNDEGNFLSCGEIGTEASAAFKNGGLTSVSLCTMAGTSYCSANGWTNKAPAKFNFNPETKEYEPAEEAYEPAVFNHSGSVVFGRNLIPNAQWEMADKKINGWYQGPLVSVLSSENNKLSITGTDSIKSPFFYLEEKMYSLSFNSDCKIDNTLFISVINKKGEKIKLSLFQQTGNQYSVSFSPSAEEYQVELMPVGMCNIANLSLYLLPLTFNEVPFNYDALHQPMTAQQCCPENSCWNGFTCAEDMSLQTEREETVAEGVSYRCLKGNWTAQEKKWDWANKVQGYCEKESQCFVAPITPTDSEQQGATAGVAAKEFYDGGVTPSCINDTEFIFDHYCQEGEWTTRTKFLIESLQSLAKKNDYPKYTVYCSPYTETLNEYGSSVYDVEQFIGGGGEYIKILPGGCTFTPNDPACQITGKLCFGGANSNLVPNEENTCVNNFCLLTHEEDKQQKTIFAVSLNQPIDDTSFSFLRSLGIDNSEEIKSYCPKEGDDWVDCQNKVGFLKYNPKLNLVAYSSEEFEFEPGTLAKLWTGVEDAVGGAIDFIGGLLGFDVDKVAPGQLPEPLKDKLTTTAFTTCPGIDTSRYFSFFGNGKSAVACVWNNTLSASYYNFVTPVCDFADHTLEEKKEITQEETTETIPLQGQSAYLCENNNLKITNPNNFAFWWPQLTGRLRIN